MIQTIKLNYDKTLKYQDFMNGRDIYPFSLEEWRERLEFLMILNEWAEHGYKIGVI